MEIVTGDIKSLRDAVAQVSAAKAAPFKISGNARYAAAKNFRILNGVFEDHEKERIELVLSLAPEGQTKIVEGDEHYALFLEKFKEKLVAVRDVPNLLAFKKADLDLDNNEIDTEALALLIEYNLIDES